MVAEMIELRPLQWQQAVLKGIRRLEAIQPINIQVARTYADKAKELQFSRVWNVPRLVMEL